jgi:hypothetical protein
MDLELLDEDDENQGQRRNQRVEKKRALVKATVNRSVLGKKVREQ